MQTWDVLYFKLNINRKEFVMNPKVSIIVPVYKVEKYLHECINSILDQTFTDFELILIDDGSPDNSGKICDEYAQKDSRVKVIHTKNGGPSSARNIGIKISKGEYIGFVDSDDTIEIDMYEKMYNIGLKRNAEIVACGYVEINTFTGTKQQALNPLGNKLFIEGNEVKENFESLLAQNKILGYASMCNKLYKRSYITDNNLLIKENIKIAEDLCFNLVAISMAKRICAINDPMYKYRRINHESIMNKKEGSLDLHLEAKKELLNTLKIINVNQHVYTKYIQYENFTTVAEYLNEIKNVLNSNQKFVIKYQKAIKLIHEQYFLNALYNFDKNYLVLKAHIIVWSIKIVLYTEKMSKKFKEIISISKI